MDTARGVVKKILKRGEGPNSRSFVLIECENLTSGKLVEARLSGRLGNISEGDGFVADGEWKESEFRGRKQYVLQASSVRPGFPETNAGILRYLSLSFVGKAGIGFDQVNRLVGKYGESTIQEIVENPQLLIGCSANPRRYENDVLKLLSEKLSSKHAAELLKSADFEDRQIEKVLAMFKTEAYETLKKNPYDVMNVPDIEFDQADKLGSRLGITGVDERRIIAAIWQFIRKAESEGSSCVSLLGIMKSISSDFNIDATVIRDMVVAKVKSNDTDKFFAVKMPGSSEMYALTEVNYRNEIAAANGLCRLVENGRRNDPDLVAQVCDRVLANTRLDEFQRRAVLLAATEPICIITGGPGTGKSTILESLLKVSAEVEDAEVFVSAPTGKAAKRGEEVTGEEAQTLQRLLGMRRDERSGRNTFAKNRQNPLPDNIVIVVDEVSMMDNELMAALFIAMPESGRVILQGDPYQLPSVGVGRVLSDMLEMNLDGQNLIPVAHLVNIYRQDKDSKISTDAALINEGITPDVDGTVRGGVTFRECMSKDIAEQVIGIVRAFKKQGMDPQRDVAVITPQKTGYGGTWELNSILAKELNPDRQPIPGVERGKFDDPRMPIPHIGDRVMLTDNDVDTGVMNGDIGVIEDTYPDLDRPRRNLIGVRLEDGRKIEIPTTKWRELLLAYVITCHKSQGSQYPVVILPFSDMHRGMAQRTLVYTAWTRAKKMVIGVGEKAVFKEFVETNTAHDRYTILRRLTELLFRQKGIAPRGDRSEPKPYLSPSDRVVETKQKAMPKVVRPKVQLSKNRLSSKVPVATKPVATTAPSKPATTVSNTVPSTPKVRPQIRSNLIGKRTVKIGAKPVSPTPEVKEEQRSETPTIAPRPKVRLGMGLKTSRKIKVPAPSDEFKP